MVDQVQDVPQDDQTERTIGATLRGKSTYIGTPDVDITLPEIDSGVDDGINPLTGQPYIIPNTEVMGAGTPEPYEPNIPVERTPYSNISSFSAGVGSMTREYFRGIQETFTVRRISYGVGVERVFPVHSPKIAKIETIRHGKVRRAKLYYLRGRVGKAAKITEKLD